MVSQSEEAANRIKIAYEIILQINIFKLKYSFFDKFLNSEYKIIIYLIMMTFKYK